MDYVKYIKYASAVTILIAMVLHTLGITPWNAFAQLIGAAGWCYCGWKWRENSILLNFLPQFFIIVPLLVYTYM
jgi:hypothetical protein